tara:strand:- start:1065 stop:1271 length:207 start_codon:yes stop_codon:yes gene_type:complete
MKNKANTTDTLTIELPEGKGEWAKTLIRDMVHVELEKRHKMANDEHWSDEFHAANEEFIGVLNKIIAA